MVLDNGIDISIKKGYSKQMRKDGRVIEDETGSFHRLHTLSITKEYIDRNDDVEVLEMAVSDLKGMLQAIEKELARVHQARDWFKGTDLEF